MVMIAAASLSIGVTAFAAEPAPKPDCADKQKALDDANAAVKTAAKPDLSTCKDKKGAEKTDCEKPLKEKGKTDAKAAKDKEKDAKMALDCCKNPKKKGCSKP
jgi:hypothetical protein